MTNKPPPIPTNGCRINRYLAQAGLGSRRKVEDFIRAGRVSINDQTITNLAERVRPNDRVHFDGRALALPEQMLYYALYKPAGYTVTMDTRHAAATIYALIPKQLQTLKYAGRLDRDSRGLLLLSNDGIFLNQAAHPSLGPIKRYVVTVDRLIPEKMLRKEFLGGLQDEEDLLRASGVKIRDRELRQVEVLLKQGKKRQIRRMFGVLGIKVEDLFREAIGRTDLAKMKMKEGELRPIDPASALHEGR